VAPAIVVVTALGRPSESYWYASWNPGAETLARLPMLRLLAEVPQVHVVVPSGSTRLTARDSLSYA
jgi:hypothetical protein